MEHFQVKEVDLVKFTTCQKCKCSTNVQAIVWAREWGATKGFTVDISVQCGQGQGSSCGHLADHHFMQNMTRPPSYFTLALSRVTRTGMGRRRSKEPSLDQKFYAPTLSTVPTRSGGSFLEQQMPWLHLVHLIQLACLVHSWPASQPS